MDFAPQNPLMTNVPTKVEHFQTLSETFALNVKSLLQTIIIALCSGFS